MRLKIEIWLYASWLYPNWNKWKRAPLALTDWLIRTPLLVFHNTETERHPFGQQLRRGWWPMLLHMGSFLLKLQSWGPNFSLKAQILAWRPRSPPWSPNLSLEVPIPPKRPRSQPQNSERGLVCLSSIGSSIMLELKVQKCTFLNEIAVVIISLCVCAKKVTFYSFETAKNWSFETAKKWSFETAKKWSFETAKKWSFETAKNWSSETARNWS